MSRFPSKKDLIYWILFLVIFNIFVLTFRLSDNLSVLNFISFAGTVTSILLAAVTIIYSFYQNSTFDGTIKKLEESGNKIEEITNELKNITNFKEQILTVNESVQGMKEVVSALDKGFNNMQTSFESKTDAIVEFSKKMQNDLEKGTGEKVTKGLLQDFEDFVNGLNINIFFILLFVSYNNQKEIDMKKFVNWYGSAIIEDYTKDNGFKIIDMLIFGILISYEQLGFFEMENSKVLYFDSRLQTELWKRKENIMKSRNEDWKNIIMEIEKL